MGYIKNDWKDEIVLDPSQYKIIDATGVEEIVSIERVSSNVVQEGIKVTAAKLNNMEQGIEDAHTEIEQTKQELQENKITIEKTASVIEIPDSATGGQFSDIKIGGMTWENKLGVANVGAVLTVIADQAFYPKTDGSLTTLSNITKFQIINGHKYFVKIKLKDSSTTGMKDIRFFNSVSNQIISTGSNAKVLYGIGAAIGDNANAFVLGIASANGNIELDYAFTYDLTAMGLGWMSEEQANSYFHYISQTKSTLSARLTSIGKNVFDFKQVPTAITNANITLSDIGFTITSTSQGVYRVAYFEQQLEPNTTYRMSAKSIRNSGTLGGDIGITDPITGMTIRGNLRGMNPNFSFTTPSHGMVRIYFYATVDISENGSATYADIQLEKGTVATEYKSYELSQIYIPTIGRSVNGTKDEINLVTGEKIQKTGKVVYDGSGNWSLYNSNTDYISFYAPYDTSEIKSAATSYSDNFGEYTSDAWRQETTKECFYYDTNGNIYVRILKSKLSTLDVTGFKQWLSENLVTCVYQLENIIETPIPPQILQAFENGMVLIENKVPYVAKCIDNKVVYDGELKVIDVEKGGCINTDNGTVTPIGSISYDPDTKTLTSDDFVNGSWYELILEHEGGTLPTFSATVNTTVKDQLNSHDKSIQTLNKKSDMQNNQIKILNQETKNNKEKIEEVETTVQDQVNTKLSEMQTNIDNLGETKIDKPTFATNGNIAVFDSNKNIVDIGKTTDDFLTGSKQTGQVTYTGTLSANGTNTNNITIGSGYKKGKAYVGNVLIFFDTNSQNTKTVGYRDDSQMGQGGACSKRVNGSVTINGGVGDRATGNGDINIEDFYISGSYIKIVFKNSYSSSRILDCTVDWEVEK